MAGPHAASPSRSWLLALSFALGSPACDEAPARHSLRSWPPGEPMQMGACEFLLERGAIYHSTEWHLEVELRARNTGTESTHCAFSAQLVSSSNTELTRTAKASGDLPPQDEWVREAAAREANETGMSKGSAEGAWIYVELSEGQWPISNSVGVAVEDPERIRPPG